MRVWYVVADHEYELEPVWTTDKRGRIHISGAGLYTPDGVYRGWWQHKDWPSAVRTTVREQIAAYERRQLPAERLERVRVRSMISKTK